jgi:hypothetical protein
MQRKRACEMAKASALERTRQAPTPLAAWRDAAGYAAFTAVPRPAKALLCKLLAAAAPPPPPPPVFKAAGGGGAPQRRAVAVKPPPPPPKHPGFSRFSFAGAELNDFELRLIAASLKRSLCIPVYRAQLVELDLSHCGIGVEGAESLARGLAGCVGLERLNLSHNPLLAEGAELILRGLLAGTRWLEARHGGFDRFGRPVRGGRPAALEDAQDAVLRQGGACEDDMDPRGCTMEVLALRKLAQLKAEAEAEVAARGGYVAKAKDGGKEEEGEDTERRARRAEAAAMDWETAYGAAFVPGEKRFASERARKQMAKLTVEGLSGRAESGFVIGGDALKEVMLSRSSMAALDAKAREKTKRRALVRARPKEEENGSGKKKEKGKGRGYELPRALGGGASPSRSPARSPSRSPSRGASRRGVRAVLQAHAARFVSAAEKEAAALKEGDALRRKLAQELGLGVYASRVTVEDSGSSLKGKLIRVGDKTISEQRLSELANRMGVTRQAVIGYRLTLPVEVAGVSGAVLAARRARLKRAARSRMNNDEEVKLEDSEDDMLKAAAGAAGRRRRRARSSRAPPPREGCWRTPWARTPRATKAPATRTPPAARQATRRRARGSPLRPWGSSLGATTPCLSGAWARWWMGPRTSLSSRAPGPRACTRPPRRRKRASCRRAWISWVSPTWQRSGMRLPRRARPRCAHPPLRNRPSPRPPTPEMQAGRRRGAGARPGAPPAAPPPPRTAAWARCRRGMAARRSPASPRRPASAKAKAARRAARRASSPAPPQT